MKKFFGIVLLCGSLHLVGAPAPKWLNDQGDQTDIYAIPLDSSEEEEKAEEKQLQPKPSSPQNPHPSAPVRK